MNEPRDETWKEEYRRRAREIIERHFDPGDKERIERILEAESAEEVREIESEVAAPILDELLLLEAEMRDRLREDDGE